MKSRTIILVIVVITMLFLARSIYSDYNSKKIISACILAQTQTSSIEEAKQICVDKFKCVASSLAIKDIIFADPSINLRSPKANVHAKDT